MTTYLMDVWRCRYFWMSLVKMDLRTRYRRSILGLGWSLLNPICMTAIMCVVFHSLFGMSVREYAPFLFAGLATWTYLLSTATQGCQCFFQGESYIRQHPAPLAVYPLRTALGGTIHFLLALCVTLLLSWYCRGFGNPLSLISLIPTILLLFIIAWSAAVLMGFANVHFQDTQHLSEVLFQIVYYASPVIYIPEKMKNPIILDIIKYNPVSYILQLIRAPIVEGRFPSLQVYAVSSCVAAILLTAAGMTIMRLQRRLIFHL